MIASLQGVKHEGNTSELETVMNAPAPSREPRGTLVNSKQPAGSQIESAHDTRDTHPPNPRSGERAGLQPTALAVPTVMQGATGPTHVQPTCASTVVTDQLSDALRQLSLAVDISPDKAEGTLYRPEWYSQHMLKGMPTKSLDYQKRSLYDLQYGMTCVLEHLLNTGNPAWHSYLQHMKYIFRQAASNNYIDVAFLGYDWIGGYLQRFSSGRHHQCFE